MTQIDTSTEAIAAILEGVTPGPWRKSYGFATQVASASSVICNAMLHENARFIAAARELVPALAAERDRLAAQLAEARAEGWRKGIEAAAAVNNFQAQEILDNAAPASAVNALRWAEKCIRALPMPADLEAR